MRAISTPMGAAGEYSKLSLNVYAGCSHGCLYCYNKGRFNGTCNNRMGKATLENIESDLAMLERLGNQYPVLMSFVGDPYDLGRDDNSYAREVLQSFKSYGQPFQVLTKGGTKAVNDFDLYTDDDFFASTLTFINDGDSNKWEPGAALPQDRLEALMMAHDRGIKTWVSCEPVIDPKQTLELIEASHEYTDFFWVGKWNHDKRADAINWHGFRTEAETLLKQLNKNME